MAVNILIVDNNYVPRDKLEKKLTHDRYTTKISTHGDEAMMIFEETLPHIVIMDFEDIKSSSELTKRMIEFDHTACIFGVVPKVCSEIKSAAFASGVRALVQSDSLIETSESADEIIKTITNACTELKEGQCSKCWENNIFTDLSIKQ